MRPPPAPAARWLAALGPRSPLAAQRSAAWIAGVAGVLNGVFTLAVPATRHVSLLTVLVPLVVGGAAVALRLLPTARTGALGLLTALTGVVAVTGLDLATHDATAGGQIFFCLPVLYAASQLRPAGAVLVTCCSVAGDAWVTTALLPTDVGLADLVYVGTTLVLVCTLLARAGLQQDRLVRRLTDQAAVDALTGLANRHVLDEAARAALAGSGSGAGTALVLVDVDRFKAVNDRLGHPVGDDALRHIAGLLRTLARPCDVVARMGGDELALLLPGCPRLVAVDRAQQLVEVVRRTPLVLADGQRLALSVSAGAAHTPGLGADLRALFAAADAALYDAKRSGRDRVGSTVHVTTAAPAPTAGGPAAAPPAEAPAAPAR